MRIHLFAAVFVFAAICGHTAHAAYFETSIAPRGEDKYKAARYRLWIPDDVRTLRGIMVKQHGCGRNGITHANDLQWQALARKHGCALLGTHLPTEGPCSNWCQPDNGSGHAFLAALTNLAAQSRHAELATVPWALWGHSGGAHWSVYMAERFPDRVVGVFAQSGGMAATNSPAAQVPILFNRGAQDFTNIIKGVDASFTNNRPLGARWAMSIDPTTKHECGQGRQLAIPYFDELLGSRLPARRGRLKPVTAMPWLVDAETAEIGPEPKFNGDKRTAGWLPGERMARAWREFVHTGRVEDPTRPETPSALRAVATGGGIELTWQAEADLESGLKTFRIYRNGGNIGQYEGVKTNWTKGNFQTGNYGDEAEPAEPGMSYTDTNAPAGRNEYRITSVNWQNLESKPSRAAKVVSARKEEGPAR